MSAIRRVNRGMWHALALCFLGFAAPGMAQPITLADDGISIAVSRYATFAEDPHSTLTFTQITQPGFEGFKPLAKGADPNFSYTRSAYWLRVTLDAHATLATREWVVELPHPTLDKVEFYLLANDGALLAHYQTGDTLPFASRPIREANFAFPAEFTPGKRYELYLHLRSNGNLSASALLWPRHAYQEHTQSNYLLAGCCLGLLAGLVAYNLVLFIAAREVTYLFYVLFLLAGTISLGAWNGFFFEYLWSDSPLWGNVAALVGFNAAGLFAALFARAFLNTARELRELDRALVVSAAAFAFLSLGVLFIPYTTHAILSTIFMVAFSLVALFSGAYRWVRGFTSARFFLLAWVVLSAAVVTLAARNTGLLPSTPFTLNAMPIGGVLGALLLSLALAERIHVARNQKEAAEAANRAKDDFIATVSHEIRTPLTVLLGSVSLLIGSQLDAAQANLARSAKRSGEQLLHMLNDLIDLSRISTGQLRLETMPFTVGALVKDVVELMEPAAQDKNLALKVRLGFPRLPLLGDQGRIRQVLLNLVHNAIKFTDKGEVRIEVMLIEQVAGRATIRFSVNDTGIGIKPIDQAKLFLPFSRLEGAQARHGSGLGLAISRRLIEAMGGTIRVFSRPGQGSRFWFDLDLLTASQPAQLEEYHAETPLSAMKLLVVDDVDESRQVVAAQLSREGHSVTTAASGEAALEQIQNERFDIVLMDLHMPGMGGLETVRQLRKRPEGKDLLVFALTADVTSTTQVACINAGMQGVIAKPLRISELTAKLMAWRDLAPSTHESREIAEEMENPLLDTALLADRLSLLGAEGIGKVIRVFAGVAHQRLNAVTQACEVKDREACARAAHVLRGSAGAVGLPALLDLSGAIELAAQQDAFELWQEVERLPPLMESSLAALEQWCVAHGVKFREAAGDAPLKR